MRQRPRREYFGAALTRRDDAKFTLEETRALRALGRVKTAARQASHALGKVDALDPQDRGRAYLILGKVFLADGDQDRARELLERAVELLEQYGKPYVVEAANRLADVLEAEGRPEEALRVLRRALSPVAGRPAANVSEAG